jgi:membrane protease YdiL (CAAX protease family)
MHTVLTPMIALFVTASLALWWRAIHRWRSGEEIVPREPFKPVRWGLVDFLLAFFLYMLFATVVSPLFLQQFFGLPADTDMADLDVRQRSLLSWGLVGGSLVAFVISNVLIQLLHRCSWQDRGWVPSKRWNDIRLGALAFVMLAPPVYGLQILLTQFYPSSHPLVEAIKENPDIRLVVAGGAVAVIAAPIIEEYLLRVLLQGWLEKLAVSHDEALTLLVGEGRTEDHEPVDAIGTVSRTQLSPGGSETPASHPGQQVWWPVFVSSAVFAVMHFTHGPDWIPLFVFALGLGYLYHQTHRIVPCIVVHLLLNACSYAVFVASLNLR